MADVLFGTSSKVDTVFRVLAALVLVGATATLLLPPDVRGRETAMRPDHVALLPEEWWPRRV
jgi:hypothetical protein